MSNPIVAEIARMRSDIEAMQAMMRSPLAEATLVTKQGVVVLRAVAEIGDADCATLARRLQRNKRHTGSVIHRLAKRGLIYPRMRGVYRVTSKGMDVLQLVDQPQPAEEPGGHR